MAGLNTGVKKKLTISPCQVDAQGNISVDSSKKAFEVMLNPSDYSHKFSIDYNKTKTLGQAGGDARFSAIKPETVNIKLVIDGTGVVPGSNPSQTPPDVKTQIQQLQKVVYDYDGSNHEPNHVRLLWGTLIFFSRLESLSVDYTLFQPSGEPLRAKVDMGFTGFMSKEEQALKANKSSPDLTHVIEVKAGDTLPMLCDRIYKDASYYLEIARVNELVNFRDLPPGLRLYFPPLV